MAKSIMLVVKVMYNFINIQYNFVKEYYTLVKKIIILAISVGYFLLYIIYL